MFNISSLEGMKEKFEDVDLDVLCKDNPILKCVAFHNWNENRIKNFYSDFLASLLTLEGADDEYVFKEVKKVTHRCQQALEYCHYKLLTSF